MSGDGDTADLLRGDAAEFVNVMGRRPRLLDLFCKAGGAGVGYHRAGFDVVGVDIEPQPNYPFQFVQADALAMVQDRLNGCWHESYQKSALPGMLDRCLGHFDAVHASPVCKRYSRVTRTALDPESHPDQIEPIREILVACGLPYVIENVPEAPLVDPVMLCGSMFDLDVQRHRNFETNWGMPQHHWPCRHGIWAPRYSPTRSDRKKNPGALARVVSVAGGGHGGPGQQIADWRRAMQIDWMNRNEMAQAIPPAYTEWIGRRLLMHITSAVAA